MSGQVEVEVDLQLLDVVGMYPAEPLLRARTDLPLRAAEHRLPARAVIDLAGPQVPVPESVVGTRGGQGVALLAFAEGGLGALARGDIAAGDHDAVDGGIVEQGVGADLEGEPGAVGVAGADLGPGHRAGAIGQLPELLARAGQLAGMDEVEHVAAEELFGAVAEHPLERTAGVLHPALAVEHRDHVERVGEERLEVALAGLQPFLGAELPGDVAIDPDDPDLASVKDDRAPQHRHCHGSAVLPAAGGLAAHRAPLGRLLAHIGRVALARREDLVDGASLDLLLFPAEQAGEFAVDPTDHAPGIEQRHRLGRVLHQLFEVRLLYPEVFRDLLVLDHEPADQDDGGERDERDQESAEVDRDPGTLEPCVARGLCGPEEEDQGQQQEEGGEDGEPPVAQPAQQDHGPREGGHAGGERDEDEGAQSILCAGRRYVGGDTNL